MCFLIYPTLCVGGVGAVSATANFLSKQMVEMYNLLRKGRFKEAKEIHYKFILPFWERVLEGLRLVEYVKVAMKVLGLPSGPPRRPLLPLNEREQEEVKKILKRMGLFRY